jgi:hypothetical protein
VRATTSFDEDWSRPLNESKNSKKGYTFRLRDASILLEEVAEWVEYEQKCCSFFGLGVEAAPQKGPIALRVTGEPGVKDFIRMEFAGIQFK